VQDYSAKHDLYNMTLVLEGGLLKEMGTVLRYNCAFSNVVVKFCAIFTFLTCQ